MTTELVFQGLAVGALAAFPLGPVGMLCLQRTLSHGARTGVASASGLALASAIWCLAAVQGLGILASHLPLSNTAFRAALGLLLTTLGIRNLFYRPAASPPVLSRRELAGQLLTTLLVVGANPLTLLTVAALLGAFGLGRPPLDFTGAVELGLAVFLGGFALWLVLARTLICLRDRLGRETAARVSRVISFCTLALGIVYFITALWTAR